MSIQDDIFNDTHVQKALHQLCKEIVKVADKRSTDLHFLTFALGLKDGSSSVSRAGCRCTACAMLASQMILADAMGLSVPPVEDATDKKEVH